MLWAQINSPCAMFVMVSPASSWKLKVFWLMGQKSFLSCSAAASTSVCYDEALSHIL